MDVKAINEGLNFYLRPQTFPVAVKLLAKGEQLPEKVRIPSRDLGRKLLTCLIHHKNPLGEITWNL